MGCLLASASASSLSFGWATSQVSLGVLLVEDHRALTLAMVMPTAVLLFLLQHLDVPQDAGAGVAVLIGKDRALCGELAGGEVIVLSGDGALAEERD